MHAHSALSLHPVRRSAAALGIVLVLLAGCGASTTTPSVASFSPPASLAPSFAVTATAAGAAHVCAYVPGAPVASMPAEVVSPQPTAAAPTTTLPPSTAVDAATTKLHLTVFDDVAAVVAGGYVDPKINGKNWPAIVARYRALVRAGLSDDDFYLAMELLIGELGDHHSSFESPAAVKASDAELAGHNDYVGIGADILALLESRKAIVILTFPGSPAERAGLQPHDAILDIDGQPVFDASGASTVERLRGPAGTTMTLTVQRLGGPAHDLTVTRANVDSALPVEFCVIPRTRVGYIFLPSLFDETLPAQVQAALQAMTAGGPLAGLVIDNRLNTGGSSTVLEPMLGFFVNGNVGTFKSRTKSRPLNITGIDVGGSQHLPLVVLVGPGTVSFGEIMSGILQAQGRAVVIGQTTYGTVDVLDSLDLPDGSRAWIAAERFAATGARYGPWKDTGIEPDISAPTRWDLFTEADDPALAAALKALGVAP